MVLLTFICFLFYVVAVIGFNQTTYTFEEGDGTVEVCAALQDPTQIAPNVVVELMGSTSTYPTCCVNVYNITVVLQRVPMGGAPYKSAKEWVHGHSFQMFWHSTKKDCPCHMLNVLKANNYNLHAMEPPAIKVKS